MSSSAEASLVEMKIQAAAFALSSFLFLLYSQSGNATDAAVLCSAVFKKGDVVTVQPRMGPGSNKPGGVARISRIHVAGSSCLYDVRYVLGSQEKRLQNLSTIFRHADDMLVANRLQQIWMGRHIVAHGGASRRTTSENHIKL